MFPGASQSRARISYFSLSRYSSRSAEPRGLAQLPAGVDAVGARQCGRQHAADHERRPPVVEVVRVDVRSVGEQVAAEVVAHLALGQLGEVVADLSRSVAPGEVRVLLREADLRQLTHHLRLRERLREEDHLGVMALHLADAAMPRTGSAWCGGYRPGTPGSRARPRARRCAATPATGASRAAGSSPAKSIG